MPCVDYPCCGHGTDKYGNPDCPDSSGRFRCVECGRTLPTDHDSSICPKCLERLRRRGWEDYEDENY